MKANIRHLSSPETSATQSFIERIWIWSENLEKENQKLLTSRGKFAVSARLDEFISPHDQKRTCDADLIGKTLWGYSEDTAGVTTKW